MILVLDSAHKLKRRKEALLLLTCRNSLKKNEEDAMNLLFVCLSVTAPSNFIIKN